VLLIVTVGLVIVALALLIFGFAENSVVYIYLSILSSVVAAVVLTIFTRVSRRRALRRVGDTGNDLFDRQPSAVDSSAASAIGRVPDEHAAAGPAPDAPTSVTDAVPPRPGGAETPANLPPLWATPGEAGVAAGPGGPASSPPPGHVGAPPPGETELPTTDPLPALGGNVPPQGDDDPSGPATVPAAMPGGWEQGDWDDEEVVFPIEDYDSLRVPEILPLLGELDPDELEEVRAREVTGRARGTLIKRIDMLLASFSALPEGASEPPGPATQPLTETAEPLAQPGPTESVTHAESPEHTARGGKAPTFPIPEYDQLRPSEILPRLSELNREQLESIAAHERQGLHRRTILVRISRLQGEESAGSDNF
jgi:hypothetical protein